MAYAKGNHKDLYNQAFDDFILRNGSGPLNINYCYSLIMNHPTINTQVHNCFKQNINSITLFPYNNGEVLFDLDPYYVKESITKIVINYQGNTLNVYFDREL